MSILKKSENKRIVIGKILGAHGLKGALRLQPLTDFPSRFYDMDHLNLERLGKPVLQLVITSVTELVGKGQFIVHTDEVSSREEAESLKGAWVFIPPEERVTLEEDELWVDEVIGLKVLDMGTDQTLGHIVDILQTGSNDVYVVETPEGIRKMIPAIREVIEEIDAAKGFMKINLLEGLWD